MASAIAKRCYTNIVTEAVLFSCGSWLGYRACKCGENACGSRNVHRYKGCTAVAVFILGIYRTADARANSELIRESSREIPQVHRPKYRILGNHRIHAIELFSNIDPIINPISEIAPQHISATPSIIEVS